MPPPYTLPTSNERPYTKLTDSSGATLCATWRDGGACDVPCGNYNLHRFDRRWSDRTSSVATCPADGVTTVSGVAACPSGWAATLERFATLPADYEEIGALDRLSNRTGYCAVGRQWPTDGDILLEVVISTGGRGGDDQLSRFAPASIEWNEAGSEGDLRQPLTGGEARSCARIIGCDRY